MTYGAETWSTNKRVEAKLAVAQRAMERRMLGITIADRKTNNWIRQQTKVRDITAEIKKKKWTWAGHVARMKDNRWTQRLSDWQPRDGHRNRGRPLRRWRDEIDEYWGKINWKEEANDRKNWRNHAEAFIQQCID